MFACLSSLSDRSLLLVQGPGSLCHGEHFGKAVGVSADRLAAVVARHVDVLHWLLHGAHRVANGVKISPGLPQVPRPKETPIARDPSRCVIVSLDEFSVHEQDGEPGSGLNVTRDVDVALKQRDALEVGGAGQVDG